MPRFPWSVTWLAAIALPVLVAAGFLLAGIAAAQEADEIPELAEAPVPGCHAQPVPPEEVARMRAQFAARLAQALGKP